MERERESRNPVRERQPRSGDVGFVTWRSSSFTPPHHIKTYAVPLFLMVERAGVAVHEPHMNKRSPYRAMDNSL